MNNSSNNEKITIDQFQLEVGEWSDETFGTSSDEIKRHLADEIIELVGPKHMQFALEKYLKKHPDGEEIDNEEESGDVLLLLLHLAHKEKFSLLEAAQQKQTINLGREWLPADENGVIRHKD